MTEGLLLRRIQENPSRESVRSCSTSFTSALAADMLLGLLEPPAEARPDLRIVVMSATSIPRLWLTSWSDDLHPSSRRLNRPAELQFEKRSSSVPLERVASAVDEGCAEPHRLLSHFLLRRTVERCAALLSRMSSDDVEVATLHGGCPLRSRIGP